MCDFNIKWAWYYPTLCITRQSHHRLISFEVHLVLWNQIQWKLRLNWDQNFKVYTNHSHCKVIPPSANLLIHSQASCTVKVDFNPIFPWNLKSMLQTSQPYLYQGDPNIAQFSLHSNSIVLKPKLCNQVRSLDHFVVLWFRILGIFSVEYIKRLCVFMFQTCSNSLLCTDSQYSSQ